MTNRKSQIIEAAAKAGISLDEYRIRWTMYRVALWKSDFRQFARDIIRIRTKFSEIQPLELNSAQKILHEAAEKQLHEESWVRLMGLKGRRQGFSTYVAGRGYWRATLWSHQKIYLLSHEMPSSNALFDMVNLMQEHHPFPPQVGTDNAKELEFVKRGSSYQVATAGQKAGGRGGAVTFFHGSEAAWWTNAADHFAASVQGVDEVKGMWGVLWSEPENPLPFEKGKGIIHGWIKAPSEIWLETTSAGPTGVFWRRYTDAMKGIGRYRAVFVPWTVQPEYNDPENFIPSSDAEEDELSELEYQQLHKLTDAQMLWRRSKIQELGSESRFRQEYPINVTEAFTDDAKDDAFIRPNLVLKARKRQMDDPDAPLIIGVDPAGAGGDRFAIAFRRGDKIIKVIHRNKIEHDESVAWLSSIIDGWKPNRMCIDRGSMGQNIISSLRNIDKKYSEIVRGIDFGGTSRFKKITPKRAGPWNRRAEMYGDFKNWLLEGGSIPDDDDLASDISGPRQKWRANNDWLLESKTEMKSRGIRSSDLSDACVLTFAIKEWFEGWNKPKQPKGWNEGSVINIYDQDSSFNEYKDAPNANSWMI